MEIPFQLKKLYKHWESHTQTPKSRTETILLDQEVYRSIIPLITERMRIWEKKTKEEQPPYTHDPLLAIYKFCNVYRELDRQTIAYHTLLKPLEKDFPLWLLNMFYCRMVCNPLTVEKTGLLSYDLRKCETVFHKLQDLKSPKYGTAYVFPISAIQRSPYPTREKFIACYLPSHMEQVATVIHSFEKIGVADALPLVLAAFGYNLSFLWTEVLIDVAYQFPGKIDLFKRFPIGPGSRATMKQLNPSEEPEQVCLALIGQQPKDFPFLTYNNKPVYLSAENWEGIGCEYRKYSNLLHGKGRHRLFRHTAAQLS